MNSSPRSSRLRSIALNTLVACISLLIPLGAAEGLLRFTGFEFRLYPKEIRFAHTGDRQTELLFQADPDLLWVSTGYDQIRKFYQANNPRIAFIGDSCTALGDYAERFGALYAKENPGRRTSVARLATISWSSYQGLQLLRRDVGAINPKIATFYFGWNDHWKGFGVRDSDAARANLINRIGLGDSRLFQFLAKSYLVLTKSGYDARAPVRRVPPDQFRANLREIVATSRDMNIVPVLITAPHAHVQGREPEYLKGPWLDDLSELVPLHQEYVAIVREIAKSEGAALCDLEQNFSAIPQRRKERELFWEDGIHLHDPGNQLIAEFLYQCFAEHQLLDLAAESTGLPDS